MYRPTIAEFQSKTVMSKECRVQHDGARSAYSSTERCRSRARVTTDSHWHARYNAALRLRQVLGSYPSPHKRHRRPQRRSFPGKAYVLPHPHVPSNGHFAVGWVSGQPQNVQFHQQYEQVGYGPGGVQGDPSLKARLIDLISAVRTLLRSASFCPPARYFTQLLCHVSTSNRHKHNRHYIRGAPRLSRLTVSRATCITSSYRHSISPECCPRLAHRSFTWKELGRTSSC